LCPKKKEVPKQTFFWRTEKRQKISHQWNHLLAIQWKGIPDVFFLNTAHEDVLVQAPSSRVAHHKIKPAAVLDYKYSVERSDQMLSHYSLERKTKLWRKLFSHLLDLVVVNAQILHNKSNKKNTLLEIFYEKVAKGRIAG
jgi:hypothetical protein